MREGIPAERIFLTGSTGVDACLRNWGYASTLPTLRRLALRPHEYAVVTVHRAANTEPHVLRGILTALNAIAEHLPLVFPMHPRTRAVYDAMESSLPLHPRIILTPPQGYLDALALIGNARVVLTDSGGIQEETAALGIPTLILREETEWQAYVNAGTHHLVGTTPETIVRHSELLLSKESLSAMRLRALPAAAGAARRIAETLSTIVPCDQPIPFPAAYQSA